MKLSRVLAVTKKQFLTIKHDKRTLALMLLSPVMAMLIFGFAFGTSPKHLQVIVVNQDKGSLASEYINKMDHDVLSISTSTDVTASKDKVTSGDKIATIIFPSTFSTDASPTVAGLTPNKVPIINPAKGTHINVFLDTTNQQLSSVVSQAIGQAGQDLAKSKGSKSGITVDISYAFEKAKDARYIDFFVPGIMAFAITLFTTLLTLLAFVGERVNGTFDRLRVTPATETEIVIGYEIAFGIIAAIQGALILTVALLVYNIMVVGSIALAMLFVILVAIDAQAIGILISSAAQRESQAVQFLPFIIFPIFLLSGIFVAVKSLPLWLQPFSNLLPPTWGIEALRDVMLRGWGLEHLWPHVLVLAGFAIFFTLLAIFSLKRSRNQ
jgi:ABC-2 type transport system permease protein